MFRLLVFRVSRRGIATIIGGLIILTLILTALGTMVFVSQQYSQFQQTVNKMDQYKDQEQSESIVANSPGLTLLTSATVPGWGNGCTTTYNCYNATISNLGGVGIQIVRIYVTSTGSAGSGCSSPNPTPCILNPTSAIAAYAFNQAEQFLNAGEVNHAVIFALPSSVSLPYASPPPNTIAFATSRGNVFSFQWPFQIQIGGQSQSAFSAGIVKVAYQSSSGGYDSKNEPGPVAAGSKGTVSAGYCHSEPAQPYPAGASYAEELTGVSYANVGDSGVLWFVNPWVTQTIIGTAANGPTGNTTTLYLGVNITNTGNTAYGVAGGTLDLTWYGSNHIDGTLIGVYYGSPAKFYSISSPQSIPQTKSFLAIFRVTTLELSTGSTWPPPNHESVMFWGSASLTDSAKDSTFVGGVSLSSGLWIPYSC